MNEEKIDNQLNLALDSSEEQRRKTADLNVGYNPAENTWELIIKYTGDLQRIRDELEVSIVELLAGYAIVTIKQYLIGRLSEFEEVEYIEMPKGLFFAVSDGRAASCINQVQIGSNGLMGNGVLVAVIDSGIDYTHPDFTNDDGTTRILDLWDQTLEPRGDEASPAGYSQGTLFTEEEINRALAQETREGRLEIVPSEDLSGHGTHVAGIAAGNGRASNGVYRGVASKAQLLIVKLGNSVSDSFPKTTQLMTAIDYVIRRAIELEMPLSINVSFGNNYGAHGNNSLLEQYINDVAGIWRSTISIGTGNEASSGHHASGVLVEGENKTVELSIAQRESTLNLQIWKNFYDDFDIIITAPSATQSGTITKVAGKQQFVLEQTEVLVYYGEPTPYNTLQEIYIEFIPSGRNQYLTPGEWVIQLIPKRIVVGNYHMWFPTGELINPVTRFLRPSLDTTLTIPSTAEMAISVGAYDSNSDSLAYFSGRGYTIFNQVKPDIVAPGVDIVSTSTGGGYTTKTGTSMATPFVAGSAALLMEWGIIRNQDPFLYGQKVKAYLIAGARKLPFEINYPNTEIGFGALCLRDTFRWIGIQEI